MNDDEEMRERLAQAWEEGRQACQKMWVTVTAWGGSVPDGFIEQMNPYLPEQTMDGHPEDLYREVQP